MRPRRASDDGRPPVDDGPMTYQPMANSAVSSQAGSLAGKELRITQGTSTMNLAGSCTYDNEGKMTSVTYPAVERSPRALTAWRGLPVWWTIRATRPSERAVKIMSLHLRKPKPIGKHAPTAKSRYIFGLKQRLRLATVGAIVVFVGMFRLLHSALFVINRYAMPVYSGEIIATGTLLLLLAAIPPSWLDKTAAWLVSNRHNHST
jgi:hypothetical protein